MKEGKYGGNMIWQLVDIILEKDQMNDIQRSAVYKNLKMEEVISRFGNNPTRQELTEYLVTLTGEMNVI